MQQKLSSKVDQYTMQHHRRRVWQRMVRCLACVVVFCTTYALILPAITKEGSAHCGLEEHTHNEACFTQVNGETLVCAMPEASEHIHTDSCYQTVQTQAASEGHTHSDACYTIQQGELVCDLAEAEGHTHTDGCYSSVLICQDMTPEHVHTDGCYEAALTCGLEESVGHTHDAGCYAQNPVLTCGLEESPAVQELSEKVLICDAPEAHVHSEECYAVESEQTCQLEEHTHSLICFSDPEADLETAKDWERSISKVELTGVWADDVLAIAESQLGYTESTENYTVMDDGVTTKGITRYGQWYGVPYGDWCAMFVSFCLDYAQVEDFALDSNCRHWIETLDVTEEERLAAEAEGAEAVDRFSTPEEYTPVPGDLIFFDYDHDGISDHIGLVEEVTEADPDTDTPAMVKTIEGNSNDRVQYMTYELESGDIAGYGILPEQPTAYTYSDDNVQVAVVLPEDTAVPADAVLKVTPVEAEDDGYDALVRQAESTVDGELTKIALYDISFYTSDEAYIPVDESARVTMRFAEPVVDPAAEVQVLHYAQEDEAPVVLEEVSVAEEETVAETSILTLFTGETMEVETVVEFRTEGFSTFAVVQVETGAYDATILDLGVGQTNYVEDKFKAVNWGNYKDSQFIIVSADMKYALSSYAAVDDDGEDKLQGMEVLQYEGTEAGKDVYVNANKHLLWTFEESGVGGAVLIKSVATGEYLELVRPGVAITSELTGTSNDTETGDTGYDPDDKQAIYAFEDDDTHKVGFAVNVGGTFYYLNRDGGGDSYHTWSPTAFEGSANNQFYLCEYKGKVETLDQQATGGVDINEDANMTYIIAGVNYDNEVDADTDGNRPTILTGATTAFDVAVNGDNADVKNAGGLIGEVASDVTITADGEITSITYNGDKKYLWMFQDGYLNLVGTGQYLFINNDDSIQGLQLSDGANRTVTVGNATVANNAKIKKNVITISSNGHYLFLYGNDPGNEFTALNKYKNAAVTAASPQAQLVRVEYGKLIDGLEGKTYYIAGVNNKNASGDNTEDARKTPAFLTVTANGDDLASSTGGMATVTNGAVTSITATADAEGWIFEDVGYGTYNIKSVSKNQYLNIDNGTLTLSNTAQTIEVIAANDSVQDETVKQNRVCLRNTDGDYVLLQDNTLGKVFTGDDDNEHNLDKNRGTQLVLVEYTGSTVSGELATDLAGKVAFIVAVNNGIKSNDGIPALASTKTNNNAGDTLEGWNINRDIVTEPNGLTHAANVDTGNNLGWYFEPTEKPGVYHIVAVNGANAKKYLNITDGVNLGVSDTPTDIEVVKADTTGDGDTTTNNVISLRTNINGKYYYVHLGNSQANNEGSDFHSNETTNADEATHFQLVEITEVTNVVNKINTLLDQLVEEGDGYAFSDAAYTGSAATENDNNGQQGGYSNNYQQPFMDDYDQAQAYRREMQLLAREIRTLYAQLPEEDQRYVWRYEIVDSGGDDENDLKWLWDTVETVTANNPIGVKVELFNYDHTVNNTGLAYGRGAEGTDAFNDPDGFTFYHKIQYDEYTQVDKGRDEQRPNGGGLGSDDSVLTMQKTLDANGYPVVTRGAGNEYSAENNNGTGSLQYLFDPTSKYHVASMTDGGGLFQKDSQGFYYYYCNQNAAYYVDGNGATIDGEYYNNEFVLYDTVLRPMYIHGAQPNALNDVYNFLPFNNPYDDLIFDEPNTIDDNNSLSGYGDNSEHAANTEKTGYLNERSDMWFGMTIEFSFLMANDGMIDILDANGQPTGQQVPMEFDFYGDDDVWVYIDNQLVLDLGGVKGAEKGSINFYTGAVFYEDGTRADTNTTLAEIFKDVQGAQLNGDTFANGVVHTVKFFYMERGGNVSYCGLKFNMPSLPENFLMVTKTRENEEDTTGQIIGNPYHTFRVVEANADGKPVDASGNETTDLDEMVPYFKANTVFDICLENTTTKVDSGIVDENGYFTVPLGYSAVFNNLLELRRDNTKVKYAVVEVLFDEETQQYKHLNYTLATVQPRGGASGTDLDFSYTGAESLLYNKKIGTYTFTSGIQADAASATLNLSNVINPPLGKLAVTKQLASGVTGDNTDQEFTILVELGGYAIVDDNDTPSYELVYSPVEKGTVYTVKDANGNVVKNGDSDTWTVTSTDGTITLKPGQTATFDGIVAGTHYRVSELADTGWTPTYSATVQTLDNNGNATGTSTEKNFSGGNAEGEFGYKDSVEVTVTNQNYTVHVDVPLTKKVDYAAFTDTFNFQVEWINNATTLEAANEAVKAGNLTYYSGGSIKVTPEGAVNGTGGKVTIGFSDTALNGMPNETGNKAYYKISEADTHGSYIYDDTYYIIEVTLNKATESAEASAEITGAWKNGEGDNLAESISETNALEFTNHRTTSVQISKEVTGGNTSDTFTFNYTIKYPDANTKYKEGSFTLNHNGVHNITGVPIGAIVEVTEADRPDYVPSYNVTAYYEAEYGTLSGGANIVRSDEHAGNASGHAFVGNIAEKTNGDGMVTSQSVTIPTYTNASIGVTMTFDYATANGRTFKVTHGSDEPITFTCVGTGGWWTWDNAVQAGPTLNAGSDSIMISGNGGDAPNLDRIRLDYGRISGSTAAVNVLGDGDTIRFYNEPRSTVTVHKTVEGSDKTTPFNFTATAVDKDGKTIDLPTSDSSFSIAHDEYHVIGNLPYGAKVTVTETSSANKTHIRAVTRLEAEDAVVENGAGTVNASYLPSDKYVGNVGNNSGAGSVTFTVTPPEAGEYTMRLHYNTNGGRSFGIQVNDGTLQTLNCSSSGNWGSDNAATTDDWAFAEIKVNLTEGANTIVVKGDGNYAPNLDYIELVWATSEDKTIMVGANSDIIIEVVNETGYLLPESGGMGTLLYTLGGTLLTAAPVVYGFSKRRRRERRADG